MFFDQFEFDVCCEWGGHGVAALAPHCDAIIIVDVLSFSTSVDVATQRGALVFPYKGSSRQAADFAASVNAHLAERHRSRNRFSLSPESLMHIPAGTRIVLPSPNGATLSLAANRTPVLASCLRNAQAVARAAQKFGSQIAVIPAGERWPADQSLRPCFEDLVGAGAIISYLSGRLAPEAAIALAAFQSVQPALDEHLMRCSSGKELIERGYTEDVRLAAQLNASDSVPILRNGAFVRAGDQK